MLVRKYWPSLGIKRSRREPNNSPILCAQEMLQNTKIPLVLHFQLNEQQKLKSLRVSGTEMYCNDLMICSEFHPVCWFVRTGLHWG